jgi:hypothetical protein
MIAFEDEKWVELYPRVEAKWMKKGKQEEVLTPGYNRRTNYFITLFWPKKYGFVWNRFKRRRSREFRKHVSNVFQHAKRHGTKKLVLFMDHAPCHKTQASRRLIRRYGIIRARLLPKRAPKLNPTEWIVNRPLNSYVCTNRSYSNIDDVNSRATDFLRKHRRNLCT